MKWWNRIPDFDKQLICSEKFGTERKYTSLKCNEIVELYEDSLTESN